MYHRSLLSWHHLGEQCSQKIFGGTAFPRVPRSPSTTPLATAVIFKSKNYHISVIRTWPSLKFKIWRSLVTPKFLVPPQRRNYESDPETFWRCKNVLEVLYHHAKFGVAWISPVEFLANVNVLRYVCYMLSAVRLLSVVCLSVCCLSVCDVGAPYSGG